MNDENTNNEENNKRFELHAERLATTDYQGNRVYLYPEDVQGFWKKRREITYWFLIILYLVLPWVYVKGKPFLMVDIFNREFTLAGNTFHGMEPIFIFLTLISGLFFIAFLTATFGRVWCGWACPQTVFIQSIFLKIETLVEGKARERRELDRAPMSASKFIKKTIKWGLFTAISLHITHTFAGYFVGPRELFHMTMGHPFNNFGIFTGVMIATTVILVDFGWFREQFCIIACPYGRIQSVLMDGNSLVVAYDAKRGEPRRAPEVKKADEGHCINCYACVKVCPTGIDIRRGTQLECIACTLCIDACDEIMTKVQLPTGLIRYSSENELNGKKHTKVTPRAIVYITVSFVVIGLLITFLFKSTNLKFQVYRGVESPFQQVVNADGTKTVINHFTLKATHQGDARHEIVFNILETDLQKDINIVTPMNPFRISTPEAKTAIFFKFDPKILINGKRSIHLEMKDKLDVEIKSTLEVPLVGPTN